MESKIVFVGTSSGKTSLKRFHSSLFITDGSHNVLIDSGDGVSKALLNAGIDACSIDTILISHFHPDHIAGIGSLLVQMKMNGRTKPLSIYTTEDLVQTVKFFLYNQYIFMANYDFTVKFCRYDYDEQVKLSEDLCFIPRRNSHLDEYINDAGMGQISFESSSFLFTLNNKNIFYTGDIGDKEDLYIFNDYELHVFISESKHSEPSELIEAFEKQNAHKLYFTHIADEDESKFIEYIKPSKIYIAADGTEICL